MATSKKASKKKKSGKAPSAKALPKSLRKGALPSSVDDVLTAGLGALSRGGSSFEALVARGRAVQAAGSDAARDAAREVEGAVDRVVGSVRAGREVVTDGLQERVEAAVATLLDTLGVPSRDEVEALRHTIDALEARLGTSASPEPDADRTVYEVRKGNAGWAVQRVGASRAATVCSTKKEALHEAREVARRQAPSTLVVRNLDGSVSASTDYDG